MAEEQPDEDAGDDLFDDSAEWIAAEGRQLLRALTAYDPKAAEVGLFYLSHTLARTAGLHLRQLPRWQIGGLWFDGLNAARVAAEPPVRLRVTAWLVCVAGPTDDQEWWREPLEFELRLCRRSGRFRGYRFRVGDSRSRAEKAIVGLEVGMAKRIEFDPVRVVDLPPRAPDPVGGWLEEIVRGEFPTGVEAAEPGAAADPAPRAGPGR